MSGIAGLLRFDRQPVSRPELERVANALRAHGPDRSQVMVNGNIGFVHVLMRMTPEDQFDHQPHCGPSGSMITADLRLDNRDEMLARIGADAAGSDVLAGFADPAERLGEIRRRGVADAARPVRGRDLESAAARFDTGARSDRAQCRHVASKRALLCFLHHAQRPVCAGRRCVAN